MSLPYSFKSWILFLCVCVAINVFLTEASGSSSDSQSASSFMDVDETDDIKVDGDLTGWSLVTDNSEIPSAFLFDEVDGKITNVAGGAYLGLACYKNDSGELIYVTGNNYNDPILIGFNVSTNFSSENLLRFKFLNGNGEMTMARKDNQLFWSANLADRKVAYREVATKFKMYINTKKDTVFFMIGTYYVTASALTDRFTLSSVLTTNSLFRAPDSTMETNVDIVGEMDEYILATRRQALTNGPKKDQVSSVWIAYDAALAAGSLNINLNKFTATGWTEEEVALSMRKTFSVITRRLQTEYTMLSQNPPQFDLHKFASGIQTVSNTTWTKGLAYLSSIPVIDMSSKSYLYGRAVFAAAKMTDREDGSGVFFEKDIDQEDRVMRQWFRASCGLARVDKSIESLAEKIDATSVLVNRFNREKLTSTVDPDTFQTYWFSELLDVENTSSEKTRVIMELALLKHLPGEFLSKNSKVGESISRPLLNEIDIALDSAAGMDIDKIYSILNVKKTKTILEVADVFCGSKQIEINLCALPQLYRQVSVFSMQSRDIKNPDITTTLEGTGNLDFKIYLDQLIQDKNFYLIRTKLADAKTEYLTHAKNFFNDLEEQVEDATIFEAMNTSSLIEKSSKNLADYLGKAASFKKDGFDAQLNQKVVYIRSALKTASDNMPQYSDTLKRLGVKAKAVAITDSIVGITAACFSMFQVVNAFSISEGGDSSSPGFDIGGLGDVVDGIQNSIDKVKDDADIFNLVRYFNDMLQEIRQIFDKAATILPAIEAVRAAARPLVSGGTLTEIEFQKYSQEFLLAIQNHQPVTGDTQLNSIETRLGVLGEKLCGQAQMPADQDCVNIGQYNQLIFGYLQGALIQSDEAIRILTDLTTEAINERSAKVLGDKVTQNANAATQSMTELAAKWEKDAKARQLFWFQWRKQQEYLQAVTRVGTVLNQVYILQALVQKCDFDTYINGGSPTSKCQSIIYQPGHVIADVDIDQILSAKVNQVERDGPTNVAKIPTAPQFPGDSGFIDISKLMQGRTVYFQIPANNQSWLKENNWVDDPSDLDTSVYYVTKMYVHLPPRFAQYATEEAGVTITISSTGVSRLGPALKGKSFLIPERTYTTKYDQMPSKEQSDTCQESPYRECDERIPVYCQRSDGSSNAQDDNLNPSIFSQWSMTAEFDDKGAGQGHIGYRYIATTTYVYVQYEMIKYNLAGDGRRLRNSNTRRQDSQHRRELRAEANNACCPRGQYRTKVDGEKVCVACPEGSVSQMGGLYCTYPKQSTTNSINSTNNITSAPLSSTTL